jgi:hypothetical protein
MAVLNVSPRPRRLAIETASILIRFELLQSLSLSDEGKIKMDWLIRAVNLAFQETEFLMDPQDPITRVPHHSPPKMENHWRRTCPQGKRSSPTSQGQPRPLSATLKCQTQSLLFPSRLKIFKKNITHQFPAQSFASNGVPIRKGRNKGFRIWLVDLTGRKTGSVGFSAFWVPRGAPDGWGMSPSVR